MLVARIWFRVHSFTGVITGLMLFVICWSGTFAVVSHEIDWLVTPEVRAEWRLDRASWGETLAVVQTRFPDAEVLWMSAPLYARSATEAVIDLPNQDLVRVFVDPLTMQVNGANSSLSVQRFFRSFHMNLFLPFVGDYVVLAFSMTLLTSLVAGLLFYKRWWRRFFQLPRGRGRTFWSMVHRTAGLWSVWFLLVIGITGAWYLFEAFRYDFGDGKRFFADFEEPSAQQILPPATDKRFSEFPLDDLIDRARALRPDVDIRMVRFVGPTILEVTGQADHMLVRDRANSIYLDRRSGRVLHEHSASDMPLYWRWSDTVDPLHFGDFGGLWSKAVWFVFGLVLSGLILTGTWLHAHRFAREAGGSARHRWPGTTAAIIVTLGVLGASIPYGLAEARGYGPVIDGVQQFPNLAPGVAVAIVGWVALTLAIIAAWVVLLWWPRLILRYTVEVRQKELVPAKSQSLQEEKGTPR